MTEMPGYSSGSRAVGELLTLPHINDLMSTQGGLTALLSMLMLGGKDSVQALISQWLQRKMKKLMNWLALRPRLFKTVISICALVGLLGVLPAQWERFLQFLKHRVLPSVTISRDDTDYYNNVLSFALSNSLSKSERHQHSTSRQHLKNTQGLLLSAKDSVLFHSRPASSQYFRYKGKLFAIDLEQDDGGDQQFSDKMTVWHVGYSVTPVRNMLRDVHEQLEKEKHVGEIQLFESNGSHFERGTSCHQRPLESVCLGADLKEILVKDLEIFLGARSKQWYRNRGIAYKKGYIFHGKPGCGKTSFVRAIASKFGLNIYQITLTDPNLDDKGLQELFARAGHGDIILLEDVDCAGLPDREGKAERKLLEIPAENAEELDVSHSDEDSPDESARRSRRKRTVSRKDHSRTDKFRLAKAKEKSSKVTLSGLLNAIDGVAASHGHILIMTTNHYETLDPALVRPGRADVTIKFDLMIKQQASEMFKFFYQPLGIEHVHYNVENLPELAEDFANIIPENCLSPASVQQYLLSHRAEPQRAVEQFQQWCTGELKRSQAKNYDGCSVREGSLRTEASLQKQRQMSNGGW